MASNGKESSEPIATAKRPPLLFAVGFGAGVPLFFVLSAPIFNGPAYMNTAGAVVLAIGRAVFALIGFMYFLAHILRTGFAKGALPCG
jgi:hypothetical protein